MKGLLFLLPFFMITSIGIYQDSFALESYRGYNYLDVVNPDGTHTWKGGLAPYVLDNSGNYVDGIITSDQTHYKIETGYGTFKADKQTCEINMLNDDGTVRTTESVIIYSQKDTENPVSGVWVREETNDFSCDISSVISNSTGIYITGKRIETVNSIPTGNEIHLTYKKEVDQRPKWDSTIIIGERPSQKYDKKFMWLHKTILHDVAEEIKILDSVYENNNLSIKEKDDGDSLKATNTTFKVDKTMFELKSDYGKQI